MQQGYVLAPHSEEASLDRNTVTATTELKRSVLVEKGYSSYCTMLFARPHSDGSRNNMVVFRSIPRLPCFMCRYNEGGLRS